MRVILARAMGMCFGVRDALDVAARVADPGEVTIHGELVHNPLVNDSLRRRGFHLQRESRRTTPVTPAVLVTAHGLSATDKERLRRAGKSLLDTTCPLVDRVHREAERLAALGFHILVVGRKGHVEVEGIVGDLRSCDVVEGVEDVRQWRQRRLGVVCQTTSAQGDVDRIRAAIAERNPGAEIRFVDTVCQPTKDRQEALDDLAPRVDVVVVVGGENSNNTLKLLERCREFGVPGFQVREASDLEPEWFRGSHTAGLTAGTSTLDSTIAAVHRRLLTLGSPAEAKSHQTS
ncbi:MAG: 4-hydroxy-3-methylbut-2-enyl diphosphate reductase [Planctomycetota bacterium]|nr:4-hydroxy-3-methylbut-2-enyl diphosphate reductase [Planctomycetota bacterium]